MANQKITDLTELTAPIATDQIVIVDDPAGTPISKKMELSKIMPTGGTENQVLAKSGAGYGALKWYDIPAQQSLTAFFRQTVAPSMASGVVSTIPFVEVSNDISGLTYDAGVFTFPAGSFIVQAHIGGLRGCDFAFPLIWDETDDELEFAGGEIKLHNQWADYIVGVAPLQYVLTGGRDYSIGLVMSYGRNQAVTAIGGITPSISTLLITKL